MVIPLLKIVLNQPESGPVANGQMTSYQMIDLAPEVVFLQLEQGKEAIFIANNQLQKTSIVRSLTRTEQGICFETDRAGYVQQWRPLGA